MEFFKNNYCWTMQYPVSHEITNIALSYGRKQIFFRNYSPSCVSGHIIRYFGRVLLNCLIRLLIVGLLQMSNNALDLEKVHEGQQCPIEEQEMRTHVIENRFSSTSYSTHVGWTAKSIKSWEVTPQPKVVWSSTNVVGTSYPCQNYVLRET